MKLDFRLEEADLIALARYQMEHSPALLRRYRLQRYGLLLVFGLLALVSYFAFHKLAMALYSAALAVFCFGLYPFYYRWVANRTLRQIVSARLNPAVFAPRTLHLNAAGLRQVAAGKETLIPWSRIGAVAVTPDHAFIAVDGVYGLAIPRGRVRADLCQRFVEIVRAGRFDEPASGS